MRTRFLAQKDLQIDTVDLRRIHTREFIQSICDRAKFLPDPERALLDEVYNLGKSVAEIAETRGEKISHLRRRVRRITNRVLDPRYRYVAENQSQWRPTRRKVASACVIEGLSIKEASDKLDLSLYVVRKHREAIETMFDSAPIDKGESK